MNIYIKLFSIALLALLSGNAFGIEFSWESPPSDKSIEFLGKIFGPVGTALTGPESGILGKVMQVFNIAVLTLGSIVVSYTIIVSTINTAQEGEVMGRKWSSAWIPLRAAVGAAMLIPAPTYSLIQILFMHITVLGVHAANQIWQVTISTFSTTGISGSISVGSDAQLKGVAQHLFKGLVCAELWNGEYSGVLGHTVEAYIKEPQNQLWIGVKGHDKYANICGGLQPGNTPGNALDSASWITTNLDAFMAAISLMQPAAEEAANEPDKTNWTNTGITLAAMNSLKSNIASTPLKVDEDSDFNVNTTTATNNGWLYAGSYYFAFVEYSNDITFNPPTTIEPDSSSINALGDVGRTVYDPLSRKNANEYMVESDKNSTTPDVDRAERLEISSPAGLSSEAQQFVSEITGPLRDLAYLFMDHLTERYSDPVASVRAVGSEIMITCEIIWFAIIAIMFILLIVGCTMSGIQPACFAIGMIGMVAIPLLSLLLALLWGIGCVMGIYIPMIPYLVFTFTAIGWLVLVIETIIAAPIVALGLVSPAQEVLGKAAPAVLLITGVFLRPSLMVIGFVASILLVRTVVTMINYGFSATIEASIAGIGIFGVIALVTLYGGLILAVIHECFSLIHVLPDKILRWIGGQVEQSSVGQQVKELEKSVEKGAEVGSSLMKGTAAIAGSVIQGQMEGGGGGLTTIIEKITEKMGGDDGGKMDMGDGPGGGAEGPGAGPSGGGAPGGAGG
ncbi:MAG: DotA/TraY family protein [Candidatus Berkiella sp.]